LCALFIEGKTFIDFYEVFETKLVRFGEGFLFFPFWMIEISYLHIQLLSVFSKNMDYLPTYPNI